MKRKTKRIIIYVVAGLVVVGGINAIVKSCSGPDKADVTTENKSENESYKIKPESTRVNGPLNGVFEVVDKEYTFGEGEYSGYQVSIDFKRTEKDAPYDTKDIDDMYGSADTSQIAGVGIEILDENGNVMITVDPDDSECVTMLRSSKGDVVSVTFKPYTYSLRGKPASFRITSDIQSNEKKTSTASSSSSSSSTETDAYSSVASSVEDADEVVRSAEDRVNEAVEAAKAVVNDATVEDAVNAGKAAYKLYKKMK